MKLKSTLVVTLFGFFASSAMANPEVIAWHDSLSKALFDRKMEVSVAHFRKPRADDIGELFQPTHDCVEKALFDAKESTRTALSQKLSPKIQGLAKEYYASWTAGMKALPGLLVGAEGDARRAMADIQASLDKAWTLIELELAL